MIQKSQVFPKENIGRFLNSEVGDKVAIMEVLIAPDSFKGNMSAPEVCDAIAEGVLWVDTGAAVRKVPLADGGEGTAWAITSATGGRFVSTRVSGPLGKPVDAVFGLIDNGRVAALDMASASGIELLRREELNPMKTTSYGTGQLIAAALDSGAREIIIGIGGSATNDGGIGMLSALGFRLLDKQGKPLVQGGEALAAIASIDVSRADLRLKQTRIRVACDVSNPLLGPTGASAVFGPQKGATPEQVAALDAGLAKLAVAWIQAGLAADVTQNGDGAAGGVGAALRICLDARMESGALLVMKYAGFFDALAHADLVITGEGMSDAQTADGKLCSVVARESRKAGVPVALLSGALGANPATLLNTFDYAASIARGQTSLDAMIRDSRADLSFAAENLIRATRMFAGAASA
ncbi:MAG: glycerate kinase [Treponema sp.]|jgi:glycerate kinase|nr:glycerate kinase [Treponema sp.]